LSRAAHLKTVNLAEVVRQAVDLHRQGRLAEAEQRYTAILRDKPNHFDALHLLGVLRHQRGEHAEAVRLISAALVIKPNAVEALLNHGAVLAAQERSREALASYDRALAISPANADAHYNRANILHVLERREDALASYDKALALNDGHGDAHYNRGNVLQELKRHDAAIASYDRALALRPEHVDAFNNRGNALRALDRHPEAVASYDRALELDPCYPNAHSNRGFSLQALGRHAEAVASYDRALALGSGRPHADELDDRGTALIALNRPEEALESYDRALELDPDHVSALYNRAITLHMMNRRDEAADSLHRALKVKPDEIKLELALCMIQLSVLYADEAEIDQRRAAYGGSLDGLCAAAEDRQRLIDLGQCVGSIQPFFLPYQGRNDRELQARYGSLMCQAMAARFPALPMAPPPQPGEPVRVGIVSGYFRTHSNWKIPIKGWLGQLDRQRFRLFGYHTASQQDADTAAAAALCDRFVQGPLAIEQWRQEISSDALHVLIYPEVGMDPAAAQLAAQRLAPVQCNSWGHPETSGYPTLDYYLSSDLMEPADGAEHYTERLVRLPNLSVYCEPSDLSSLPFDREDFGMRPDATVFWCGQSLYKYLPQYDQVFARIASQVGNCQFVFVEFQKNKQITELFGRRLRDAFATHGLLAGDYCVVLQRLDPQQFVTASGLCDICLDSIGWSGCNSTFDSLRHGLPIVTMTAALMRGRHSAAMLERIGVNDTVTTTVDDYVATAVRLATQGAWRAAVKQKILANVHRLYHDRACIAALETFLIRAARGGCRRHGD
jgi:predicted O-linked N-acetylglucosamine transferase (SPINDLY family)